VAERRLPGNRRRRRWAGARWPAVFAALTGLGLALIVPGAAGAHSDLVRSQPASGARLEAPPQQVRLWFSEPVERRYARVVVVGPAGEPVPAGELRAIPDEPTGVELRPEIAASGEYRVSWRVLSRVEGHVTQGEFAFRLGAPGIGASPAVPAGKASTSGEPPYDPWLRAVAFLSAAWIVGGALFTRFVVRDVALPRSLVVGPAAVLLLASCLQTLTWAFEAAERFSELPGVLDTRLGRLFLLRNLAAGGVVLAAVFRPPARLWPGLAYLATVSLGSHAAAAGDGLAPLLDWAHQVGAAAWAGGLAHLAWLGWRRPGSVHWRGALVRFSVLAVVSVAVLGATGLYRAWQAVGSMEALTETGFGRLLSLKIVLAGVAFLLGAWHFVGWRRGPASRGGSAPKSLLVEAGALVSVLWVTGLLTTHVPARQEPAAHAIRLADDAEGWGYAVELRPGWTGANDVRVKLAPPGPGLTAQRVDIGLGVEPHPGHQVWVVERTLAQTGPLEFAAATDELTVDWPKWIAEVRIGASDGSSRRGRVRFALREPAEVLTPGPPVPAGVVAGIALVGAALAVVLVRRYKAPR
jgi:copper transport protein